uniref:Fgenesh protein 132 n=1 Tax=Beta vulgaris TaxID=161934 RepID=Q20CB8_BETVU|nr:Fgenesh protein 132 [Beta vulgaris]
MAPKKATSELQENYPAEKTPSMEEQSDQESSNPKDDSTHSQEPISETEAASPKPEEDDEDQESSQGRDLQIPTKQEKKLSEWFEVPSNGYQEYVKGKGNLNINGVSNEKILQFFQGNPNSMSVDQKDLSPFHKLLFQFVWRFVLPRSSKRTQANLMDLSIIPSFTLEPENYLTKETLTRLSLRVVGGTLEFEGEATVTKPEAGTKRKLFEEAIGGSVRKSQRLDGGKSLKEQDPDTAETINLDEDQGVSDTHAHKDYVLEKSVSTLDTQQQETLAAIKQADTGIRNKVDAVISKIDSVVSNIFKRTKP